MSSGIRRIGKKPAGSAGMRGAAVRRAPVSRPQATEPAAPQEAADTRASIDYTLMSSTRMRTHNVMRFLAPKPVDFSTFTPPIKMRRRNREYYRLKNKKRNEEQQQQQEEQEQKQGEPQGELAGAGERPKADMNLIADVGGARRNKRNLFKKKTKQVYFADEEKRRLDIEEARPWALEDDDEKEVWTGDLEGGQSSAYVLFVLAEDGFRVVPVDRWYKFVPKLKYRTMTLDEAEEEISRMQKSHAKRDLWIMHRHGQPDTPAGADDDVPKPQLVEYESNIFGSDDDMDADDGAPRRPKKKPASNKHGEADEVEFEMEFDDDEELGDVRFEFKEEDASEQQRSRGPTSFFASSDDEDEDEDKDSRPGAKEARALRKLMRKREDNNLYASDREENPYLTEESEDSDESEPEAAKPELPESAAADTKPTSTSPAAADTKPASRPSASTSAASTSAKKRKRTSAPAPHHPHHAAPSSLASAESRPRHTTTNTNNSRPASSPAAAAKAGGSNASTLITKKEIIDLIRSGISTTKELIGHMRKKLKANSENQQRIRAILKEVATFKNNQLALKKPYA